MPESFQEKYCRHFAVPADRFAATMMRRTLYWHARWLRGFLSYDALAADRDFIACVGRLTRRRDLASELMEFRCDDRNLTFWRRTLRLRVSSERIQKLFNQVWLEADAGAAPPGRVPAAAASPR